ncbi:Protease OS=Streptomyces glaucescens OX=1907 GN=SGLAU_22225 PE=3 SV=1 [Streptomyces glaucescens]
MMLLSDTMNRGQQEPDTAEGTATSPRRGNVAISCADDRPRYRQPRTWSGELPEFRKASPLFGDYLAWAVVGCVDWPVPGAADHPDVSAPGAPPILVVRQHRRPGHTVRGRPGRWHRPSARASG